ncbi:MAG: amino acid adenylation domain-containing protein [Acidobacteriota bacterium]
MSTGKVANLEDLYELSPVQEGMLFHCVQAPRAGMYVEQITGRLEGRLDVDAFGRAWQSLLEDHHVLRSAFHWEGLEKPLQVVLRDVRLPIEQHDLAGLTPAEQADRIDALSREHRRDGFDLSRAPLMRVALLHLGPDRHQFVWTHHHLQLDGWSVPIVMAEVIAAYSALRDGREPPHESRRPFRDYIAWLQRQDGDASERFWRGYLAGFAEPTHLAGADRTTPAAGSHDVAERQLSRSSSVALEHFARQHLVTMNTLVQAAWAIALGCHTGSRDVVYGAAVAGRPAELSGADRMVGMFINTLPVRVRIDPAARVVDWVRELQQQQAAARAFDYSPLVDVQRWSPLARNTALFDTVLVFANYPAPREMTSEDGRLRLADVRAFERTSFPLTIFGFPESPLRLRATYDGHRFDRTKILRLLDHLAEALNGISASDAQTRVGAVRVLPAAEEALAVTRFNATTRRWPDDENPSLDEWIAAQVRRTPDALAVADEQSALTYTQLWGRAEGLAAQLRRLGVGPETIVAVCLDRSVHLLVAVLGVLRAGGAYLPIVPGEPRVRRQWMLADAGARVVVTSRTLASAGELPAAHVVCVEDVQALEPSGRSLGSSGVGLQAAYVIYTSGSTGKPKGAINSHAGIVNRLRWMQAAYTLVADDVVLQKTPVSFDVSVWELFWALGTGARVVLARPEGHKDVAYLIDRIVRAGVTTVHFVPSQLDAFLSHPDVAQCRSIRRIICSGEALGFDTKEAALRLLPWAEVHNLYGPTEAAVDVTSWRCERGGPRPVPIGRPIANTQLHVVDDGLTAVPIGVAGELMIGGVNVGRGYLGRPDLTAARFVPDPYGPPGSRLYRTGDRARYREDGAIEYLGRQDFQVKLRGFRIEPGEIESVLRGVDGVQECVVLAREDRPGDVRLVAYVVGTAGGETLRAATRGQLPDYMVPSVVVSMPALPRLSNGKLDRAGLPAPDASRPYLRTAFRAPRTPLEQTIAGIWRDVLGLDQVGMDDNFFDVGGQSLLAMRVWGKLREAVPAAMDVAIVDLFAFPTIAALAARLAGDGSAIEPASSAEAAHAQRLAGVDRLRQQRARKTGIESSR